MPIACILPPKSILGSHKTLGSRNYTHTHMKLPSKVGSQNAMLCTELISRCNRTGSFAVGTESSILHEGSWDQRWHIGFPIYRISVNIGTFSNIGYRIGWKLQTLSDIGWSKNIGYRLTEGNWKYRISAEAKYRISDIGCNSTDMPSLVGTHIFRSIWFGVHRYIKQIWPHM